MRCSKSGLALVMVAAESRDIVFGATGDLEILASNDRTGRTVAVESLFSILCRCRSIPVAVSVDEA